MKFLITTLAILLALQACNNETNADQSKTEKDTMMGNDHSKIESTTMSNDLMNAMMPSMEQAKTMKMSGDFDHDFANMMIYHHQGAIDMAEVQLSKGSDEQVKGWAKKIIDAQKEEIIQFQKFTAGNKPVEMKQKDEEHNEMHETHEKMEKDMKSMSMTGNIDKDFVMMMKTHHQSAIEMANSELSHGKKYEIKKMAQKIIEDQNKEIKEFNDWLNSHK